jgi:hypothetical protein
LCERTGKRLSFGVVLSSTSSPSSMQMIIMSSGSTVVGDRGRSKLRRPRARQPLGNMSTGSGGDRPEQLSRSMASSGCSRPARQMPRRRRPGRSAISPPLQSCASASQMPARSMASSGCSRPERRLPRRLRPGRSSISPPPQSCASASQRPARSMASSGCSRRYRTGEDTRPFMPQRNE